MSTSPGGPLWPEHWAIQADMEADRVRHRLSVSTARPLTPAETQARAAVENHLAEARTACRPTGRRKRRSVRDQWRGVSVERAYLHLHAAKIFLVDVLPEAELQAIIPDVSTRLGMVLDRNDPRRIDGERLLQTGTGRLRRAAVKQAMTTAYDASDEEYVRLRDFRNILVLAAAAVTVLTALLVGCVTLAPDAVPLCFQPAVTAPATTAPATTAPATTAPATTAPATTAQVCPSGLRQRPTGGDILIVAGLGVLGGALGGLIAIRRLRGTSTPYPVSTALAVLKVPSGALSTIVGMLLLAGGFVPGLTNLDSQRQILAYALLFGMAQHLVTRVADNRAQQLLDNLPSKDPEAKPASPPLVLPPVPVVVVQEPVTVPAPPDAPPESAPGTSLEPPPVQATGTFLPADEVEDLISDDVELIAETFPLDPEEPDEFPDDEGEPEVDEDEAAQTGTDRR